MKKLALAVTPLIAVAMMTGAAAYAPAQGSPPGQNTSQAVQDKTATTAGVEQTAQGWKDGVEAYKLDKTVNRKIDPKSSFLYTHPPVKKGPARDAYLNDFV